MSGLHFGPVGSATCCASYSSGAVYTCLLCAFHPK